MIGWRGASRYYSDGYREGFALECRALRRVREGTGLTNVVVMIPFCRTLGEADQVLAVMAQEGLVQGENGLRVYVMAEIPANIILAQDFAERFDGFSIGSNDLTQLTLGVDRDSGALAHASTSEPPPSSAVSRPSPPAPTRPAAWADCAGSGPATIRRSPRSWSTRASTPSPWRRTASQPSNGTWLARRRRLRAAPDEGRSDHAQEDTAPRRPGHGADGQPRSTGGHRHAARSAQEAPAARSGSEPAAPGTHHQGVDALPLNQRRIGRIASRGA